MDSSVCAMKSCADPVEDGASICVRCEALVWEHLARSFLNVVRCPGGLPVVAGLSCPHCHFVADDLVFGEGKCPLVK